MNIGIIGAGNVAYVMAKAFNKASGIIVKEIYARQKKEADALAKLVDAKSYSNIDEFANDLDIILLAVSDQAIASISDSLSKNNNSIIVHCSGAMNSKILEKHAHFGSLYPLYSFPNKRKSSLQDVPMLISGNSTFVEDSLLAVAKKISSLVYTIPDEQRLAFHLAAVFSNNFANHMMSRAFDLIEKNNLDPKVLMPIIKQSAEYWENGLAKSVQSGPAIRQDHNTMKKHRELLSDDPSSLALYNTISEAIQKYYS